LCMNNLHVITKIREKEDSTVDFKFLLGLINSKLLDFYYTLLNPEKGEALAEVKKENLSKLPICFGDILIQNKITDLVKQALNQKLKNPNSDTTDLENQIDQLVYQLYGLTEEEIKIVEAQ
jgi:adenine-specific DNA-methyltransferase